MNSTGPLAIGSSGWLTWALLSAVFAAGTAISAKVGLKGVDPDVATLVRTILITIVLFVLLAVTGKLTGTAGIGRRTWSFLGLSGLATGASWICYFRALKLGEASRVAPVDKLSVVMIALIGTTFLGEHLSLRGWAGVALIGVGVVCVALG